MLLIFGGRSDDDHEHDKMPGGLTLHSLLLNDPLPPSGEGQCYIFDALRAGLLPCFRAYFCLFVCLFVSLSLFVCLFVYLFV